MEQATFTQYGGEPNPVDSTGLCLLSLDGGGVRGLSTLYILQNIMNRLNHERKTENLQPIKPCELFDLIGGTSTGGLIAIMLGRLEMDVDECIKAYGDLAEAVFGEKLHSFPLNWMGAVKPRFDSGKLENAIRQVVVQSGKASETDMLDDGTERGCRTVVCAVDRYTKKIVRLRSYSLPHESSIRATICQAALATSAATTFFDAVSIGNRSFADGGLGANNPVDEVEGEAANIWCFETGDLKPLVKCFISIGTGIPETKAFKDSIVKFLGQTVVEIATETENTEKRFIDRWARHFDEKRYYRFNVDQGLQSIGLDEYRKNGVMEAATEGYLAHLAQKFRVRDCIQNLKLKQKQTEPSFAAVANEYTIRIIRQQPTNHAHWIVPFDRNPNFTGRESQLAALEKKLFVGGRTTKCAITGLGGVGKTQLVLELVYRVKDEHKNCSVIWIPATNMESLYQAYQETARQLSIPGWEDDKVDVKRLVKDYLCMESVGQWLLIFDNADDIDMWIAKSGPEAGSSRLIEYLPRSEQGCIVFTSRDRKTAVKLAHHNVVEVPKMNEDVAIQLLQRCLINPNLINNELDTKALLDELTYLPLAIIQAVAYINENGIALAEYRSLLAAQEEDVIDLLSEEFEDDGRYRNIKNPVATTWLISFEQIRRRDPLAADYLSFMACIDPKDIPQSLLPAGASRKEETNAIGMLDAYSFIVRRPADLALDLHRLVHLATRNWLRKEQLIIQWTDRAIIRLEEVFLENDYQNRSVWRTYLPHARYVLDSTFIDRFKKTRMDLLRKFGLYLYYDGRFNEAEPMYRQTLQLTEKVLGQEHPDTLTSMNNLALLLKSRGKYDEAEPIYQQTLQLREKVLGQEHPDTLTSMNNLAMLLDSQGKYDEAEPICRQTLQLMERVLGQEHPDTLTSMNNLARLLDSQGKYDEAEPICRQTLQLMERVLGQEHPDTLTSMNNLAMLLDSQGKYDEAEPMCRQTLQLMEKVLGQEHPDTLTSMNNLARLLKSRGKYDEAEPICRQTLQLREKVLGQEHPDTLTSMNNLAGLLTSRSKYDEAEPICRQTLQLMERVLGQEHPDTLTSMNNLAMLLDSQGKYDEAEPMCRQTLQLREKVLGQEHLDTLS